jgi:hypothetical protein
LVFAAVSSRRARCGGWARAREGGRLEDALKVHVGEAAQSGLERHGSDSDGIVGRARRRRDRLHLLVATAGRAADRATGGAGGALSRPTWKRLGLIADDEDGA